ncbi:MAG TPA: preprotein translocase subunit SecG [Candidatus Tumulicola sp.]
MNSLLLAAATAIPASKPVKIVPLPVASGAAGAVQPPAFIPPAVTPHTAIAQHAPWLTHGIAGIFIIAAVALVALLAVQTTKQEGLSGSIGGQVQSAYRGRLGAEEQLKRTTGIVAVVFVVSAFFLALTGI